MSPQAQHPTEPEPSPTPAPRGFWTSKAGLVTIAFLLIAAFFLLSEHWAHLFGYLLFLLLLACPLLHMFMHGGHGGHGRHGSHTQSEKAEPSAQDCPASGTGA